MKTQENQIIKEKYKIYLSDIVTKNLYIKLIIVILLLLYYSYSDLYIREDLGNNIHAFYTRLLPLIIAIILLVLQLFTKEKFKPLKSKIYNILIVSIFVMTLAKCIIHLNDGSLAAVVSSVILAVFLISLEIKASLIRTILMYLLPTLIFGSILIFFFDVNKEQYIAIANMYPIIVFGFAVNRIQNKLNYNIFKSSYLLKLEKQKTEQLYNEVLIKNEDLSQKNEEIILQQENILQKTAELEESNATKDRFFSIISHDLRSPFNSMLGFSQLLIENFDDYTAEESKNFIEIMHNSMQNAFKLLENLLIWSRSQSGNIEFEPKNNNLFLITENAIELLKQTAISKNLTLINQISKEINVIADENMLSTIIRNLISNAIKFTPQGGEIKINAYFKIINNLKKIEILIEDNGVGISKERQLKMFDFTASASTKGTENELGTGLGLILCKDFVEKHGGEIWVESEVNIGSKFYFNILASE